MYIRIQAMLFLWLLVSTVATAQTGDIRISPPMPLVPSLPESARIQSAATIGEHTLAVWGTSRTGEGNTVNTVLQGVIISDSTVVGEPFIVGGEDASPAGYVRVLALADRFMVFWCDTRSGAPGLYAQRFTLDGIAIGGDSLVDSASAPPVDMFGTPEKGYALFWKLAGSLMTLARYRRISPTGEYIGEPLRFGTYLSLTSSTTALPGMLLGSLGDGRGVIIHDDGRLDIGRFNGAHLGWEARDGEPRQKRYHLAADTSFALLCDTALHLYRSLFDTLPQHIIPVPEMREARFQSPLVTRDSSGGYSLYYTVLHRRNEYSAVIYSHHIGVTSQGERGPADIRDSLAISSYGRPYLIDSGSYNVRCDNSRYHTFTYSYWEKDWYYPILNEIRRPVFMIAGTDGNFLRSFNPPAENECSRPARTSAERLAGSDSSRIIVHAGAANIKLNAPVGRIVTIRRDYSPMMGASGRELIVGWRTPYAQNDVGFSMRVWNLSSGAVADSVYSLQPPAPLDFSETGDRKTYWTRGQEFMMIAGDSLLVSSSYAQANGRIFPGGTELREWSAVHRLYAAGPGGWRMAVQRGESSQSFTGLGVPHVAYCTDVSGSGMMSLVGIPYGSGEGTTQTVTGYDTAWNASWSMQSELPLMGNPALLLPLGEKECVVLAGAVGMHVRDATLAGRFELDNPKSWSLYHPLRDGTFLRIRAADTSGYRFEAGLYSVGGISLKRDTLVFATKPAGLAVAQSSTDSVIAVIRGGDAGVRASFLEPGTLRVLLADTLLSSTADSVCSPAGRFRGDSLIVVWEDYRTGNPEIYGRAFPLPQWQRSTSSANPASGHGKDAIPGEKNIPVVAIRPLPAGEWAEVEYILPEPALVEFSLYTLLGTPLQCCITQAGVAGRNIMRLDLHDISSGVYLLRFAVPGGAHGACRLVVR